MFKYALAAGGLIVAAALLLGRVYPRAPSSSSRPNVVHTAGYPAQLSTATSAPSQDLSGTDIIVDHEKIASLPVVKNQLPPPAVPPRAIVSRFVAPHVAVQPPAPIQPEPVTTSSAVSGAPAAEEAPPPPLDEKGIFRAVVKMECPSEDRRGKYVGSGFVMPHGLVVTAAHLIKDIGGDACQVIFPRERAPSIYLVGKTEDRETVRQRHDEQGIDIAFVFLPLLSTYPEARAVFPDAYPSVPYPVCGDPALMGDTILHFGYPASFQNHSYLDEGTGIAAAYADIRGITQELSEDQTYLFKTPVFGYTTDQAQFHPYLVARSASFYGSSGGLGLDATRRCIVGPDRGGTIGGGAGENFSLFAVMGWEGARAIMP